MKSEYAPYIKVSVIGGIITLILTVLVLIHYHQISAHQSPIAVSIDSSAVDSTQSNNTNQTQPVNPNQFSVASDIPWHTVKGNIYPYSFSVPNTLKLVTFPNDTYDIYAIDWKGQSPSSNVLVGVDNLKNSSSRSQYISESKINYVRDWWRQFGLKGVSSITQFTNSKGLKGYRAKYIDNSGLTPNDDVFFEIPDHPEYIIHLASGVLAPAVFDKIIDSVSWQTQN